MSGIRQAPLGLSWTKKSLTVAYIALWIMAAADSLEGQATYNFQAAATSSFGAHALLAVVSVVQFVVNAFVKPPMATSSFTFGKLWTLSFAISLLVISYIMQATSRSVYQYICAQIFYSAGTQGVYIVQQVFIAETTGLLDRALASQFPLSVWLVTIAAGTPLAQLFLPRWRLGYAIWTVIVPVASLPFLLCLFVHDRKEARQGLGKPSYWKGKSIFQGLKLLWYDLDLFGIFMLAITLILLFIPISLAEQRGWDDTMIIAMLVSAAVCLIGLVFWEGSTRFAPKAFFVRESLKSRTMMTGFAMGLIYTMTVYTAQFPYLWSYLTVVHGTSALLTGWIVQTMNVGFLIGSFSVGLLIKYTGHYKYFITGGACAYIGSLTLIMKYRQTTDKLWIIVLLQLYLGMSASFVSLPTQLAIQASTTSYASIIALYLIMHDIGGAAGSAIAGAIWTDQLPKKLQDHLPGQSSSEMQSIVKNMTMAIERWPRDSPEKLAINMAYSQTVTLLVKIGLALAAFLVPLSLCLKNLQLKQVCRCMGVPGFKLLAQGR